MNFKKGDKVIVKSEIENMFGGDRHLVPDCGELGEIHSGVGLFGGVPAVRVKFINDFYWWVHPKHLERVEHMAEEQHPADEEAPM